MLRLLNIIFLLSVTASFAQKKFVPFTFESAETKLIGEKVKQFEKDLYGVFLPQEPSPERTKLIIDEKGIYYLNEQMEKSEDFYSTSNPDHILYKEADAYWLFKKNEEETFDFFQIHISNKEYKYKTCWFEIVQMEEELVEELMEFYKYEKIKAKYKKGVIELKELDEEMLVYVAANPTRQKFSVDPAFSVYIKSPECVEGHIIEEIEENQYDELKLNVKGALNNTGLQEKVVIDASGIYTCTAEGDNKFYIFKPDDPKYVLKKIDNYGYVALIKMENEFYHLLIYKPSNKQINFSAIKESHDHGFYSHSEYRVNKGERLYLMCDLEKYLKFGIEKANSYSGTRMHW